MPGARTEGAGGTMLTDVCRCAGAAVLPVFVSSRRQTRLTAQELMSLCGVEDNPRQVTAGSLGALVSVAGVCLRFCALPC